MSDLALKFHTEVIEEARKHKVSVTEVSQVFFSAYKVHKREHGSCLEAESKQHYELNMNKRYEFMKKEALDYIKHKSEHNQNKK